MQKFGFILVLAMAAATLSGCTPLIIGAGGVVVVDEILEQKNGGDGLF